PARPAAPELPVAYSVGLAIGYGFAVIGSSSDDGTRVNLLRDGGEPELLYRHREEAGVAGVSRDGRLLALSHSEHGDSRHPALRAMDLDGHVVGELWDGPGRGLWPSGWSRVHGDGRMIVTHERGDLHRPALWNTESGEFRELSIDLPGEVWASWYPQADA